MGRANHEQWWNEVRKVENSNKWKCNHCYREFSGGVSRIKAHLIGKGGVARCTVYRSNVNEGVHINIASTSSNPVNRSVHSNQGQGSFGSGIDPLTHHVVDLELEECDIKEQLQQLESQGKKRKLEVDIWLEELLEIKKRVTLSVELDMDKENDIQKINELINDMKYQKQAKPMTLSTEFVGEELNENIQNVLNLLADDKVFVIGIHGMGGVGKTLLASLVENEVKRKRTFKHVFWVTVSSEFSISKLQHSIAERIGVKVDKDDERIRADQLSSALVTKEKSILILDDVWEYIDLEKVGIHPSVNGIKVILTTRLEHVCYQMDCLPSHMLQVVPLYNDYECWELFEVKLGVNGTPAKLSPTIKKIAKDIVDRCEGLPLAISVMARTMKRFGIHRWKHALIKLQQFELGQDVVEEVFKVLKRSYDNLIEKDLQNCFLFCALLSSGDGSDHEFDMGELIMKLVDKGLINGNRCLEEIFDEGNAILNKLEADSLLFFMKNTHRLVADMACCILKESQRNVMVKFGKELSKITRTQEWKNDLELVRMWCWDIEEIPEDMSPCCPRLSTLTMNKVSISHIPEVFFKYMNFLSILDLSYNRRLESLPNSVTELRSLVSLILKECDSLKYVPPLGELQKLSRLIISNSSIEEAPQGLAELINLKWLDLSKNSKLIMISESVLSNLTKIQYLDLQCTHAMITVEDVERMNMLECLGGAFDCTLYSQSLQKILDIGFGLKTYHLMLRNASTSIGLGDYTKLERFYPDDLYYTRTIKFEDCQLFSYILPTELSYLHIDGNIHSVCLCDALSYTTSSSLSKISMKNCHQLESFFCLSGSCSFCTNIHNLKVLRLSVLDSLIGICKDGVDVGQSLPNGGVFSFLKELYIDSCHSIEKLLTTRLVPQLQNLETITVRNCASMKEIFVVSNNDDDVSSNIALPRLTRLELRNLPQLKFVCKGSVSCGSLPTMNIDDCPNLDTNSKFKVQDAEIPLSQFCC